MNYTLYDPSTGQIIATISASDSSQIPSTDSYIEGTYDGKKYYIDNNQPVRIPQKPTDFLQEYIFDWTTKTWVNDLVASGNSVRRYRDLLLNQTVDQLNPIWWPTLTSEQQAEATAYRQALLDVPNQAGFPTTVEWPTKPSWL